MTEKKTMTYRQEIQDTLDRLGRENGQLRGFAWFLEIAHQWFDRRDRLHPKVAVLGPGLPEELILAAGAMPERILGGSLKSMAWSEELTPRDTDPVSRSVLGFLNDPQGPDYSDTLFLIPVSSDSMRKIAYLLKDQGRKIHIVDLPPQRGDPLAREKWRLQMRRMTAAVAAHTHTRVTAGRLRSAIALLEDARETFAQLLRIAGTREDLLTAGGRLLIQNSFYYAPDLEAWTRALSKLNGELQSRRRYVPARMDRPGVLLMGSPVYFPNYKVPFLLEDMGLETVTVIDPSSLHLSPRPIITGRGQSRDTLIHAVADRFLRQDGSPAYTSNESMLRAAREALKAGRVEGVVYHVLKGQIEYDFELERLERLFDSQGVPLFRLETDYPYQDVEQLRIRMEAFSEMLHQNRRREERIAL